MILTFLKGLLMGICDVIPGVSGGTIAFITGIYQRLIDSVKQFSPKTILHLIKLDKKEIKKLDLPFLLTLLAGILIAILLGARLVSFLLENYFAYTISFFIGLILASSFVIFKNIKDHSAKTISFGFIGLIIGILLAILIPLSITPSLFYIFISGFLAISAMFLPGISGAFILLILGVYDYMINALHNILENLTTITIFILGAILGAFTISRIISFLFKKDKNKTLYTLLGLVIGSLSIPIKRLIDFPTWNNISIITSILFLGLGISLVLMVNKYGK